MHRHTRQAASLLTLVILTAATLLPSCGHDEPLPSGVMDRESYIQLLTDLYLAEGCFTAKSNYQYYTMTKEIASTYDTLLAKHHVTIEQIDSTRQYYLQRNGEDKAIYEEVIRRIDSVAASSTKQ